MIRFCTSRSCIFRRFRVIFHIYSIDCVQHFVPGSLRLLPSFVFSTSFINSIRSDRTSSLSFHFFSSFLFSTVILLSFSNIEQKSILYTISQCQIIVQNISNTWIIQQCVIFVKNMPIIVQYFWLMYLLLAYLILAYLRSWFSLSTSSHYISSRMFIRDNRWWWQCRRDEVRRISVIVLLVRHCWSFRLPIHYSIFRIYCYILWWSLLMMRVECYLSVRKWHIFFDILVIRWTSMRIRLRVSGCVERFRGYFIVHMAHVWSEENQIIVMVDEQVVSSSYDKAFWMITYPFRLEGFMM